MNASASRPARSEDGCHDPVARWLRLLAIAAGTLILASCRSLPVSPTVAAAVSGAALTTPAAAAEEPTVQVVGAVAPCGSDGCPAACPAPCPAPACIPCRPVPVVGPYFVCDGGDAGAPAKPSGAAGITNLTAGDTVARYRAAAGPDVDETRIAVAPCACVYAPRFASVRELVKPFEDAVPLGPRGLSADTLAGAETLRQSVHGSTRNLGVRSARRASPGVAIEERLGPLAVAYDELPLEDEARESPAARIADDGPEVAARTNRPAIAIGFDVPVAWTCVQAANVIVDGRAAEVVAADRGTATLRFEEPGRAELTLCKRAGTDTARPGEEIDFTIFLLNSGDRPLADIVLADAVPSRLELVPRSPASSLPAEISTETADDGSVVVRWRFTEPLPAGASGFVRLRAVVR